MTSLFLLRKPTYPQSFMLIYGFLFELWVSNVNEEEGKNSAHHSPIHLLAKCNTFLASGSDPTVNSRCNGVLMVFFCGES